MPRPCVREIYLIILKYLLERQDTGGTLSRSRILAGTIFVISSYLANACVDQVTFWNFRSHLLEPVRVHH